MLCRGLRWVVAPVALVFGVLPVAHSFTTLTDITDFTNPWLVIGTGAVNDGTTPEGVYNKGVGDAWMISNFEIGAIKAPVPANLFGSDPSYNPGLEWESNVPFVPGVTFDPPNASKGIDVGPSSTSYIDSEGNSVTVEFGGPIIGALPQGQVITYDANVAITHIDMGGNPNTAGRALFNTSNAGIFAKNVSEGGPVPDFDAAGNELPAGVVCAGSASGCIAGNSNTAFNDPSYPNPINDHETTDYDLLPVSSQFGPGNGLTGGHDFSDLRSALDAALMGEPGGFVGIPNLLTEVNPLGCVLEINNSSETNETTPTYTELCGGGSTIDLRQFGGKIEGSNVTDPTNLYVKLRDGLNVIDFDTGGSDLDVTNANIIIDGSENARAIFRVPYGAVFDLDQSNILIGEMGIMSMNVMFFSDTPGAANSGPTKNPVFVFDDTIFNGIAFWALGDGTSIVVNNSQGCVQYVSDQVNFQDVRYTNCSFKGEGPPPPPEVPEPATLWLMALGLAGLGFSRRKRAA